MFGGNFQTWKLHSAQDYFMFFAYILAGVLVFWLIAKHMNKQRNHEKAVEKVSGRLKKICGKPGEVLKNAPFFSSRSGFSNSSFLFASSRRHIAPSGVPYHWLILSKKMLSPHLPVAKTEQTEIRPIRLLW